MSQLLAFHNDQTLKQKTISQLEEHYKQDQIIQGTYWENGKGCAVGCTIHSDNHKDYETVLGIPQWIAHLEDKLFEGMQNKYARLFPLKLIKSIPIGFSNWQSIHHKISVFLLEDICKNTDHPTVKQAIHNIIQLHKSESTDKAKWIAAHSAAHSAADSAARSAYSAACSAAYSVHSTDSEYSAAHSAYSAAYSAADSAAHSTADSAAHYKISEKLIQLLEDSN